MPRLRRRGLRPRTLDDTGDVVFDCSNGCLTIDIANGLYFRTHRAGDPGDELVVVPDPRGSTTTNSSQPARYAGRRADLRALLARPPRPIPWRVETSSRTGR